MRCTLILISWFTHFCSLRLDVGKPLSARPLLSRSWHPLQPLRGWGRGGRGSRPLAWFATRQDDGRILTSLSIQPFFLFPRSSAQTISTVLRTCLCSYALIIARRNIIMLVNFTRFQPTQSVYTCAIFSFFFSTRYTSRFKDETFHLTKSKFYASKVNIFTNFALRMLKKTRLWRRAIFYQGFLATLQSQGRH